MLHGKKNKQPELDMELNGGVGMALIRCEECGREISDRAVCCPGCGCPVSETPTNTGFNYIFRDVKGKKMQVSDRFLAIADQNGSVICSDYIENFVLLYTKPATVMTNAIIYLSHRNLKKSVCFCIEQRNRDGFNLLSGILMKYCQVEYCTFNEAVNYQPRFTLQQQRAMAQCKKAQLANSLNILSGGGKVACCPRCHSTSISYGAKGVSVGRAIVGNAVAGPSGAVIGGLSGNKDYAVCLKCGKRWRI